MHSRRQFFSRAALAGAGLSVPYAERLAGAGAETTPNAEPKLVRRGRAIASSRRGDRLVIAHAQRQTISIVDRRSRRRALVDLDGQPLEVAISPSGKLAAVTTAFWDGPALSIVDLTSGTVARKLDAGPAPFGVAFTPGGDLLVSGGEQDGWLRVVDATRGKARKPVALGKVPRGIAVRADTAWIALAGDGQIAAVDLETGKVTRRRRVGSYPDRVAVSDDGRRLLVALGGIGDSHAVEIGALAGTPSDLHVVHPVSAVAYSRRGTRLLALGTRSEVLAIASGGRKRSIRVDAAPRGLALAGPKAFTVSYLTGAVSEVQL